MNKQYLIGIDDTDAIGTKGTGSIACEIMELIENRLWGKCGFVTRHQLFIHPDIKYTSHNSSMIFDAVINDEYVCDLKHILCEYLKKESAKGSDPGICIAELDKIRDKTALVEFGIRAKSQVLTKEQAYILAEREAVFLEELGGEGIGVIGALAGVGLRIGGNDGELKGGLPQYEKGGKFIVGNLLKNPMICSVVDSNGFNKLSQNEEITVVWKLKPMLYNGKLIVAVKKGENGWETLKKDKIREIGNERASIGICEFFKPDVEEETIYAKEDNCLNCAFRRWTQDYFTCSHKTE